MLKDKHVLIICADGESREKVIDTIHKCGLSPVSCSTLDDARSLTLPVPAAIAEALLVHARYHGEHSSRTLRLSLSGPSGLSELSSGTAHSGRIKHDQRIVRLC